MFADGKPINYKTWHGGSDFVIDVKHKQPHSVVTFTVEGWMHYVVFPIAKCVRSVPQPTDPIYIMNVHTWDHPKGKKVNKFLPSGIAHHLIYHRCALNISKYELVIQPEHLSRYMKHPDLVKFARQGWLTFVIKSYNPPRIYMDKNNCYWQGVYENLALLQYWKTNVRLMFWNSDEYVSINPKYSYEQFREEHLKYSIVAFDRWMAFCKNCDSSQPELPTLSFTNTHYKITEKLQHPKLIVNPDKAGCYLMHWSGCGDPTVTLKNETAFIVHFENLYDARWKHPIGYNDNTN